MIPAFVFVEPAVPHKGLVGCAPCDPETGEAIEEAAAEEVGAEEPPCRPCEGGGEGPAFAGGQLALEVFVREDIDLFDVAGHVREREVMEVAPAGQNGSGDFEEVVFRAAGPVCACAFGETEFAVRVPVPVGDPAAEEPDLAGEAGSAEATAAAVREEAQNFRAHGWGNFLIGVERENPWLGAELEHRILLVPEAEPVLMDPAGSVAGGDGMGGVGRAAVHDDDFRGEVCDAVEAAVEVAFLIPGDDRDGERESVCGHAGRNRADCIGLIAAGGNADLVEVGS